jgi:hypothetical protein
MRWSAHALSVISVDKYFEKKPFELSQNPPVKVIKKIKQEKA